MADLLDIVPSTAVEVVKFDGQRYMVRGVSIPALASIIMRHPELRSVASGDENDTLFRLLVGVGAAAGPIIAAGLGHLGDEEYERQAANLLPEQQIKLIKAIFGLTFPNGIGSFVQELTVITSLIGGASEEPKAVKVRLKRSRSTSPTSSDEASPPTLQ